MSLKQLSAVCLFALVLLIFSCKCTCMYCTHSSFRGAEIEAQDVNLSTPLLVAAAHGQVEAIKLLICRKADIDALDKNRRSAVFIACQQKRAPVLQVHVHVHVHVHVQHTYVYIVHE